jgi:hypothetical protein
MVTMPGDDHDAEPSIRLPVVVLDAMHKICTELQDDKAALLDDLQALAQDHNSWHELWRGIRWYGGWGVAVCLVIFLSGTYRDSHVMDWEYRRSGDTLLLFDAQGDEVYRVRNACRPRVRWWGGKTLEYCQAFFDQQQEWAIRESVRIIDACQEMGFPGRCEVYRRGHERERKGGEPIE